MIPLRLFGHGAFSAGNAAIFAQSASLTSAVFFTAQFFQDAQGDGPLEAGLRLLPLGVIPLHSPLDVFGQAEHAADGDRPGRCRRGR